MSPPEKLKKTNFGGNPPRAKATAAYANQAAPFPSLMPSSLSACRSGRRQKGQQKNSKNTADFT